MKGQMKLILSLVSYLHLFPTVHNLWSWNSVVKPNLGYGLDDRGSISGGVKAGTSSLRHRIQIGFGAHPASYPMGARVKRPAREADRSPLSRAEVKNAWSYTSNLPVRFHGVVIRSAQGQLYLYLYLLQSKSFSNTAVYCTAITTHLLKRQPQSCNEISIATRPSGERRLLVAKQWIIQRA